LQEPIGQSDIRRHVILLLLIVSKRPCRLALPIVSNKPASKAVDIKIRNIQHTARYSKPAPDRLKDFWRQRNARNNRCPANVSSSAKLHFAEETSVMLGSSRYTQAISAQAGEIEQRSQALEKRLGNVGTRASTNARDTAENLGDAIASALSGWADRFATNQLRSARMLQSLEPWL
jgi:hypothetical protein